MAVRDDFSAGEVLSADDLNDTFASKLPYSYGTATPSTTDNGFLWYDSNSTPPDAKFWDGSAFQALGGGKILQVVRATDGTDRSTTSSTYVDSGLSITITPNKSTSAVVVLGTFQAGAAGTSFNSRYQLTDSSNNALSAAEASVVADDANLVPVTIIGYSTPATTSATTYKLRFLANTGTANIYNATFQTAQLFAIEVGA